MGGNLRVFMFIRYEKLQRWDDALKAYTAKATQASSPHLVLEATLGISFMMANLISDFVLSSNTCSLLITIYITNNEYLEFL